MVAKNDITGDSIQSKNTTKEYEQNFTAIFGEKKKKNDDEYWAKLKRETEARIREHEAQQ